MESIYPLIATVLVLLFLLAVLMFAFVVRIAKVGPNEVLIISGSKGSYRRADGTAARTGFRMVQGGTSFYFPLLNRLDRLSLEIMTLDVRTPEVYTSQGVPITVDGIAQIKVDGRDESIATAAEQFLSMKREEIRSIALNTMEGHLRAIIGMLTVEDLYANRDAFAAKVFELAADDFANMGLRIVSFTISNIKDENGYLDALGKKRIAEVKRDATIGEADAARDAEIGKNEAFSEATIQSAIFRQNAERARYGADAEVARSKSTSDGEIGQAKFIADTTIAAVEHDYQVQLAQYTAKVNKEKAEAELAYDLQKNITAQQVKEQEIQIEVIEKQKQLQVQEAEIKRKEKELEATVLKPAVAERDRIQTLADAENYQLRTTALGASESEKLRGFAAAEVEKAQAEAEKVQGLIAAQIAEARGRADAEALRAKGLAEAEVLLEQGKAAAEAMRLKAAAWSEYNEAAILQMFIEKLPELARAIAEPLTKTEKIVMINYGGSGNGAPGSNGMASQITKEVTDIMTQLPPVLEALTGMNMQELLRALPDLKSKVADGEAPRSAKPVVKSATPER